MTQELGQVSRASRPEARVSTWLEGVRVTVVGDSVSTAMASSVLGQFGSTLTRVDGVDDVSCDADIVLVDLIDDGGGTRGGRDQYVQRVGELNRSVWVTVSAYGMTDPRAEANGSELTLLAAGGILGHTPGPDGEAPTIPAGSLGSNLVGNVMAMAALHGLSEFRSNARPAHLDLSGQGAIIATGLSLEMAHALNDCPSVGGAARYGAPSGFFECRDGSVYVLVLEQHQWEGFRGVLSPALGAVRTVEEASERPDEVNQALARWTAPRTVIECEAALQEAGVPCATVHTIQSFRESAAGAGRRFDAAMPLPAVVQDLERESATARGHIPLPELRILDSGHVLAVPLASAWLGAMGASVTKAEDPLRLDIYRRRGPFAQGIAGPNRSAYFNHLNFSKIGLDIEVGADGSSLDIEPYDVVMHNLSPHRAALLGVDPRQVGGSTPPKLSLASSGFGRTGAWSEYRAYGTTIHAFAGLIAATRNVRGEMSGIGTPWADPLASVSAAIWILAWALAPEKEQSMSVDVSMAESLAAHLVDQMDVEPESTYAPGRFGGDFFLLLPRTGEQLAVTISNAHEAETYAAVVGAAVPVVTRRGQRFELPGGVGDDLSGREIEARLQGAGVRASLVYDAPALAHDPRLFDSEVFQFVESSARGRYAVSGLPWRFVGRDKRPLTAAPERPSTPHSP